jgi:two-component system sensor histidine kinase BarA
MTEVAANRNELGDVSRLDDIIDRDALGEVCRSFFDLFGLPIRVISADGNMLADAHAEREICGYVNGTLGGRTSCQQTVSAVRRLIPDEESGTLHACFTGAVYRAVPIQYQGRTLGRVIVGPYLPAETREVPRSLLLIDQRIDATRAREALEEMPRVKLETAERIAAHLRGMLDLILFSGHKAHLTTEMHLLSVRESYRELAEKNDELQRAYDQLKELDRLKSNFLATVSHELRTPLTSILGYSEMLTAGLTGPLTAEQIDFIGTIHNKGELLLKLISSLLDLGKLEQGHLALQLDTLDPVLLLKDLRETVAPLAQRKGIRVEVVAPEGPLPPFRADPLRLRQVLGNLLDNALKFTPRDGTVTLAVRATTLDGGDDGDPYGRALLAVPRGAVEFRVQDTGKGIPAQEHEKIFQAFYQVDGSSTREHGGTGLGLSIVKRLVDAHGGQIRIESEPGRGTTFLVTIPEAD